LVLVKLFDTAEEKVGSLTVPTGDKEFCEGEIVAVGPDFEQAAGGKPRTTDLKPFQRVFVKHQNKHIRPGRAGGYTSNFTPNGIPLEPHTGGDAKYMLFEQCDILAIVGEGSQPSLKITD